MVKRWKKVSSSLQFSGYSEVVVEELTKTKPCKISVYDFWTKD